MNKILFGFLCSFPFFCYSNNVDRYLDFIDQISQGEDRPYAEMASSLLAPECKKIYNGTLYTETREDFIADLLQVNKTYGRWNVRPADIIISNDSAVLRLFIDMETLGSFTAIVILRYNENGLITEINEVFNKVEDSYQFEESK